MLPPLIYILTCFLFNVQALAEDSKFDLSWVKSLNQQAETFARSHQVEAKEIIDQALKTSTQQKHCRVAENLAHQAEKGVRQNLELSDSERNERYLSLLVFVSFSIPLETFKTLTAQVNQVGGKVVFRGLVKNSFKETAEKVKELQQEVIIDPTLFEEYQIEVVPTFVLRRGSKKKDYDQLSGNVSLEYVLEQFTSLGSLRPEALSLLKKLRRTP